MTDDEKAKACADAFAPLVVEATKRCRHFYQAYPDQPDCACAGCIKDAIERAVAAEREACAKVCEDSVTPELGVLICSKTPHELASAIRARNGGGAQTPEKRARTRDTLRSIYLLRSILESAGGPP